MLKLNLWHISAKERIQNTNISYRGSYKSAHVLLNLLYELRKSLKLEAVLSMLLLFCNKFNIINNTGAQMLKSISQRTLNLL